MSSTFKDNFSKQATLYARYRPQYPEALYTYLRSLCPGSERAWDCGTGNGQAAMGLVGYFHEVIATDPSPQQIENAFPHARIHYRVAKAEDTFLETQSIDLITVANALHWFERDRFYAEAGRVLKPGGILTAWAYGNPLCDAAIDAVTGHLHDDILGNYWLAENRLVEQKYAGLHFPFQQIEAPEFKMEKQLSFEDLLGLYNTWSATQRYKEQQGTNPVDAIEDKLRTAWGNVEETKLFRWELVLKVGRK